MRREVARCDTSSRFPRGRRRREGIPGLREVSPCRLSQRIRLLTLRHWAGEAPHHRDRGRRCCHDDYRDRTSVCCARPHEGTQPLRRGQACDSGNGHGHRAHAADRRRTYAHISALRARRPCRQGAAACRPTRRAGQQLAVRDQQWLRRPSDVERIHRGLPRRRDAVCRRVRRCAHVERREVLRARGHPQRRRCRFPPRCREGRRDVSVHRSITRIRRRAQQRRHHGPAPGMPGLRCLRCRWCAVRFARARDLRTAATGISHADTWDSRHQRPHCRREGLGSRELQFLAATQGRADPGEGGRLSRSACAGARRRQPRSGPESLEAVPTRGRR